MFCDLFYLPLIDGHKWFPTRVCTHTHTHMHMQLWITLFLAHFPPAWVIHLHLEFRGQRECAVIILIDIVIALLRGSTHLSSRGWRYLFPRSLAIHVLPTFCIFPNLTGGSEISVYFPFVFFFFWMRLPSLPKFQKLLDFLFYKQSVCVLSHFYSVGVFLIVSRCSLYIKESMICKYFSSGPFQRYSMHIKANTDLLRWALWTRFGWRFFSFSGPRIRGGSLQWEFWSWNWGPELVAFLLPGAGANVFQVYLHLFFLFFEDKDHTQVQHPGLSQPIEYSSSDS